MCLFVFVEHCNSDQNRAVFFSQDQSFVRLLPYNHYRFRRSHGLRIRLDRLKRAQAHGARTIFVQISSEGTIPLCKYLGHLMHAPLF